jgi:hypothetical protein
MSYAPICTPLTNAGAGSDASAASERVSGLGSRVSGLGSRVSGLGSRVSGLGSRVEALMTGRLVRFVGVRFTLRAALAHRLISYCARCRFACCLARPGER